MKKSSIMFVAFIAMVAGASAAPKDKENAQSTKRLDAIEARLDALEEKVDRLSQSQAEKEDRLSPQVGKQNATVEFEADPVKKKERAEKKSQYDDRVKNNEDVAGVADMFNSADKKYERAEKNRQYDDRMTKNQDVAGVKDMFKNADAQYKKAENDRHDDRVTKNQDVAGVKDMFKNADAQYKKAEKTEEMRKQIEQLQKKIDEMNKKTKKDKKPPTPVETNRENPSAPLEP